MTEQKYTEEYFMTSASPSYHYKWGEIAEDGYEIVLESDIPELFREQYRNCGTNLLRRLRK